MSEFDPTSLPSMILSQESDLLEFKERWYDLESNQGKAKLARDVMAIANTVGKPETGQIIIGVEDRRHGGKVRGVTEEPSSERIHQILSAYCNPMPDLSIHHLDHGSVRIGVIHISWSEYQPHYCMRDVDQILSTDVVYTRRGPTVGTLKPTELEDLIRRKDARMGRTATAVPIEVGFVAIPDHSDRELAVRVGNLTEEPIGPINANLDIALARYPELAQRQGLIANMILKPGEQREFTMNPMTVGFYSREGEPISLVDKIWSRWLDIRLNLTYQDRDGLIKQIVRTVSIS